MDIGSSSECFPYLPWTDIHRSNLLWYIVDTRYHLESQGDLEWFVQDSNNSVVCDCG